MLLQVKRGQSHILFEPGFLGLKDYHDTIIEMDKILKSNKSV
jgi:hypothetical protein